MPMPLPQLDNRTYADFVDEAQALIPLLYPDWTDHNPADPGITLIELFAWVSELLIYRMNQIPETHYWAFLKLLNDTRSESNAAWENRQELPLEEAIRQTVSELRARYRAVTPDDFEYLACAEWPGLNGTTVSRAHCVAQRNLEQDPQTTAIGHVSLVIVPHSADAARTPQPSQQLCNDLCGWLDIRRLLGTRLHVVGPT